MVVGCGKNDIVKVTLKPPLHMCTFANRKMKADSALFKIYQHGTVSR